MKYLIAILLIFLLACSDDPVSADKPVDTYVPISGNWRGKANHPSSAGWVKVDILVRDKWGVLEGAGAVLVIDNSYGVSIDGVVLEGVVSITMIANMNTWNFSGVMNGARKIIGRISGPGFNNLNMELTK